MYDLRFAAFRCYNFCKMTRFIRFFALFACGFCGILCFSSCSRQNKQNTVPSEPDLVVFTPHPAEKTEAIIREFRQRTGLTVREVHGGTGELLSMLKGGAKADVFWGGGIESLESSKQLFLPYVSSEAAAINPSYMDSEGRWTGFSVMTMVIVYNSVLVDGKNIPHSWSDLKTPFYSKRVFIPNPEKSGSAYSMLNAILLTSGGENWDLLGAIKNQASSSGVAENAPSVHTAVASGEYFAGLTSEDSALAFLQKNPTSPLAIVYPEDGTLAVPDGVALVNNAANEDAAKAFIDFVLSQTVQNYIVQNWMRESVRNDIAIPEKAMDPSFINIMPYDIYEAARNRELFLEKWRKL